MGYPLRRKSPTKVVVLRVTEQNEVRALGHLDEAPSVG